MQPELIRFNYAELYEWYRHDTGHITEQTDDVIVTIYTADSRANRATPFKTPNMAVVKVRDGDPLVTAHAKTWFAHGMFLVYDANTDDSKPLYVVFPHEHKVRIRDADRGGRYGDVQTMVTADHFSLCMDHNDKTTPLHFHHTSYVPNDVDPESGGLVHTNNYLPATFDLPWSLAAFKDPERGLVGRKFRYALAAPMLDVLSRPWWESVTSTTEGGGRRRRQRNPHPRGAHAGFDDLWTSLPIHKIVVIGVKVGATFAFTAFVHDRLRHEAGTVRRAVRFELEDADAHDESKVQREIVRLMEGLVWHDFEDLEEDDM